MLRRLDCIWLCLLIFGLLTVSKYDGPVYKEREQKNAINDDKVGRFIEDAEEHQVEEYAEKNLVVVEIIKTKKFLLLYLLAVCHLFYGYYMSSSYK